MDGEAYFNSDSIIKVDTKVIGELKAKACNNVSGRYRLCMHHAPEESLHEMFIVRRRGDYGRPEKHLHTAETHLILDGILRIIVFNGDGKIIDFFGLAAEDCLSYRIDAGIYHMSIPLTEQVVYYEAKLGPFPNEGNMFAEWAPEPGDKEKVKIFMEGLEAELKSCPMETKK